MARRIIELMDDMHLSSQSTFLDYYYAMQSNNISQASSILTNNPTIKNQIMTADNINILLNETYRRELQPKVDIDYFLAGLQAVFEKMIFYTQVRGEWSKDIQYNVHNFVYYNGKGYYVYTNSEPPIGTLPTDTKYWLEYDVRGAKGYGGIDLNLKFAWDNTQNYKKGDVVIFQNKMWYAVADNTNYEPNLNHYPWVIISMPKLAAKTPIQKAIPTGYDIGDFWWQITEGDDVIVTTWSVRQSEPTPRFASAAFSIGTNIYVTGGIKSNFSRTNTNEMFDTVTNTWSVKASAPTQRARAMTFSIGNNGYVVGGQDNNGNILSSVEMYNSTNNTWTTRANYPIPIISGAGVATDTLGYIIGGETTNNVIVGTSYSYNPTSNTWTAIANKPTLTYGHTLATNGTTIFAIGGINSNKETLGITEAYDIASNTWSQKDTLSVPRSFLSAFIQKGVIYAVGGLNSNWYSLDTNERYDILNNEWTTDMPMNYARSSLNTLVSGNKGYAIGGIDLATSSVRGYNEQYNIREIPSDFEMIINIAVTNNIITENDDEIITESGENIIREDAVTNSGGKTVSIPMVQGGTYDYWVDWGDGMTSTKIRTYNDSAATHTYAQDGEYTIKLTGTVSQLQFTGNIATDLIQITKCKLNLLSIDSMFKNCINLNAIPEDMFDNSIDIKSAVSTFENCVSLKTIPIGLFDNNINITSFENTFWKSGITSIPIGLFNSNNAVINFNSTFKDCSGLVSIPANLFSNNKLVINFYGTFARCTSLTSIPNNLLISNPTVQTYSYMFSECSGITSLPTNLLGNACASATNFSGMFNQTKLNSIPEGLFRYASNATNFDYVFNNTNITAIPAYCFNGNNATNSNAFDKTKIITIGDYGLNGLKIDAGYLSGATSLTTLGNNVFSGNINITNLFLNCSNLVSIGNMDWTGLSGTSGTFSGCSSLTNLSGFKDRNTLKNPTIAQNFGVANSTKLTKQSLLNISDSLVTLTPATIKTLYLSTASLNLLTDVEKLVIINKYWNLNGYTPNITEQIAKDLVLELKGGSGLTANIVETTSLYYYVDLVDAETSRNAGRYVVNKTTGYVYDYDNAPEYEYNITTSTDGTTYNSYWVPKGTDGDSETTVLRNKLVELNTTKPLLSIQVGNDNSKAYQTGFAGAQDLSDLCSEFAKLQQFSIQDSSSALPTSMGHMFYLCFNLITVDFNNINTTNVTSMDRMFFSDGNLKTIKGLENADTSNVIGMRGVFENCSTLTNSDLSFLTKWSNSKCTDMGFMFSGASGITSMINIKMPNVTNAASMYSNTGLTSITGNLLGQKIQDASLIFSNCSRLTTLPSDYRTIFGNNSSLEDVSYAFAGCTSLKVKLDNDPLSYNQDGTITIDETKRNNQIFRNCPNLKNASYLFSGCTGITDLPVFVFWYNTKLTTVAGAFLGCSNMAFQAPETGAEAALLHNNTELQDISKLFQGCKKIVSFLSTAGYWGYGAYDTLTKLTNIFGLFKDSGADSMLFDIGLPKNSPNITNISEVYSGCESVTSIPFGSEVATNMPKLQDCSKICYNCTNINQFGDITGDKVYANNVIYPIAQLSTITEYDNAFTNCTKVTDYANLPMGWRNGSTEVQDPNNIAIALAKIAWGINPDSYTWTVSSTSGNEYTVQCRATGSTALTATYIVNVQTGKVTEQ